jgi:hypothetical protein
MAGAAGTSHSVTLTGLASGTTYYFNVRSIETAGWATLPGTPFITLTPVVTAPPPATATPFLTFTEGENGARNGFDIVNTSGVSAGKYIVSARTGAMVTWSVYVPVAGTYYLWGRVQATSAVSDTLFVTMDDGPRTEYSAGNGRYSVQWQWSPIGSGPMAPLPRAISLARGWHKLYIESGDVGVKLDGFLVSGSPNFVPTDQTGLVRIQ